MNREIKFRARCIKSGSWIYGDLIHGVGSKSGNIYILPRTVNLAGIKHCDPLDGVKVASETVGQYTSLKDLRGKEIYEGDICKCWIDLSQDAWEFINEVIYKDGAFGYSDGHNFHSFAEHPDITKPIMGDWEVIGNIHENPELIA